MNTMSCNNILKHKIGLTWCYLVQIFFSYFGNRFLMQSVNREIQKPTPVQTTKSKLLLEHRQLFSTKNLNILPKLRSVHIQGLQALLTIFLTVAQAMTRISVLNLVDYLIGRRVVCRAATAARPYKRTVPQPVMPI